MSVIGAIVLLAIPDGKAATCYALNLETAKVDKTAPAPSSLHLQD